MTEKLDEWQEYKRLVLETLKRLESGVEQLRIEIATVKSDVEIIKDKELGVRLVALEKKIDKKVEDKDFRELEGRVNRMELKIALIAALISAVGTFFANYLIRLL